MGNLWADGLRVGQVRPNDRVVKRMEFGSNTGRPKKSSTTGVAASIALLLCFATIGSNALALTRDQARAKGLAWLIEAQSGDGSWVDPSGNQVAATATVGEALALSGVSKGYVNGADTSWLFNAKTRSNDSLARSIIALARGGQDTSALVQQLLAGRSVGQPAGTYAAWGAYPGYQPTAIDTALAFEAFVAAKNVEANNAITTLNGMQHVDGGWSYSGMAVAKSNLSPTAYALRALAAAVIAAPSVRVGADSAVTAGISWLLAHKKNDGGYAEDSNVSGSNDLTKPSQVMETALVWGTLTSLQQAGFTSASAANVTQALASAETFLLGKQLADGSWSDEPLQTATVMRAWATTTLADTKNTGVPDAVQAVLTSNYNVTDVRTLPKGNGNPVPAVVAANNVQDSSADAPTLPEWGAILMAALLMFTMWRSQRQRR